ncbi:hypothetical protein SprV_0100177700 [Sparganum proliferum]
MAGRQGAGGVFSIRNDIVGGLPCLPQGINNRLMSLRLLLRENKFATVVSAQSAEQPAGKSNRVDRLRTGTLQGGITALSETLFSEGGQQEVDVGYTFWNGRPKAERHDAGVVFVIRNDTVGRLSCLPQNISDRLKPLRLLLRATRFAAAVNACAPSMINSDGVRSKSCEDLHAHLATVS